MELFEVMSVQKYSQEFIESQKYYVFAAELTLAKVKSMGIDTTFAEIEYCKAKTLLEDVLKHST